MFKIFTDLFINGNIEATQYPDSRNDGTRVDGKSIYTDEDGNFLYGRNLPFYEFSKNDIPAANQTTALLQYDSLTVDIPETGNYEIEVFYIWSLNSGGTDFIAELQLDGVTLSRQIQEPQDIAGTGIIVLRQDNGGTVDSGTDQRHPCTMKDIQNITAGSHTINLTYSASTTFDEPTIYQSLITIKRVS